MKKIYIFSILVLFALNLARAQCSTGGAAWLNGLNNGIMRDTGLIAGSVMVYANTVGTMTGGRPLYGIGSSTWKGLTYAALVVTRAYSSPGSNYTSFKLQTPLDSNRIHLLVDNIRGDLFNWETQRVKGFNNGVPVAIDFKDPVNGAYITGGNTINGSSTTTSLVQSSMRAFFQSPVDSIVVQQVSSSDWIIAELMIECDYVLDQALLSFSAKDLQTEVRLQWKTGSEPYNLVSFSAERSADGINWINIDNIPANGSYSEYSADDRYPIPGFNFYRLKYIYADGKSTYSQVLRLNRGTKGIFKTEIFPNPARDNLTVILGNNISAARIYDGTGRMVDQLKPIAGAQRVGCSQWPAGFYFLVTESKNGEIFTCKFFRQ